MFKPMYFYPYVIQIGENETILYINFASDITKAFRVFMRKHPQIRNSKLRVDLFDATASYTSSKRAHTACVNLINKLEDLGYEVIAGAPLMNRYWSVYVIEIGGDPMHVYVGETNYPIEKRLQQHVYRFNPSRYLLKEDVFCLAEKLCERLPSFRTKTQSLDAEANMAQELRFQGYRVEGGH
jgi:hypothetical protein